MTPARIRQINIWQRAGSKSRIKIARKYYTGNINVLYHQTMKSQADKILSTGFKAPTEKGRVLPIFFSTKRTSPHWYGDAEVKVHVPHRKSRKIGSFSNGEQWRTVSEKVLAGRKIRRVR